MLISYSERSKFKASVANAIKNSANPPFCTVNLGTRGYSGEIQIDINPSNSLEFSSSFESNQPTRFPARIKAAVTAIKDAGYTGYTGKFNVRCCRETGILTIS